MTETTITITAEMVSDTIIEIKKRGWAQKGFEKDDGSVCPLGGFRRAINRRDPALENELARLLGFFGRRHLMTWNDVLHRTEDQVMARLRVLYDKLIDHEQAQQQSVEERVLVNA